MRCGAHLGRQGFSQPRVDRGIAGEWTVIDDGLVKERDLPERHPPRGRATASPDGDQINVGGHGCSIGNPSSTTGVDHGDRRAPRAGSGPDAAQGADRPVRAAQRSLSATPATNREIAAEVCLSVDGVKSQLRVLCDRFGLNDLPQNEKRGRLAQAVLATGLVTRRDF